MKRRLAATDIIVLMLIFVFTFSYHETPVVHASADWIDEYNCDKSVYSALAKLTHDCRVSFYVPSMKKLRKLQTHVSGKDVLDQMQDYCTINKDASDCVEEMLPFIDCLRNHVENFQTMIRRSDWYCHDSHVREPIRRIYDVLPMEALDYNTNKCYNLAPTLAYTCVRRYLNKFDGRRNRRGAVSRIANSFRCTYRKLARQCPHQRALLLTTIEYDWMIVPPPLGVNISDTILRAYRRHL